jgi:hypothetical protein
LYFEVSRWRTEEEKYDDDDEVKQEPYDLLEGDEEEEYEYEEVEHDPSSLQGNDIIYPETQLNYGIQI